MRKNIGESMFEDRKLFRNEVINIYNLSQAEIKKIVKNCTRKLKYYLEKMWFDYQALFDKARNKILSKEDNIQVRHVDFNENIYARNGVFSGDKIDKDMLIRF